jgi:hypothetical protein
VPVQFGVLGIRNSLLKVKKYKDTYKEKEPDCESYGLWEEAGDE